MPTKKKEQWNLDPSEVNKGQSGLTIGGRKKLRQSRALDDRNLTVTLRHIPTGITVEATIPVGNYSRIEMKKRRNDLYAELFKKLERQAAKELRIPGF